MNFWNRLQHLLGGKKFVIIWVFIILILLVYVIYSYTTTIFKKRTENDVKTPRLITDLWVNRVEPFPDQTGVSTNPTIKIYFDRSVKEKDLKVITNPEFAFKSVLSPKAFNVTITLTSPLKANTKYTIQIKNEGKLVYKWSFTTGSSTAPSEVVEKLKKTLPYRGDHFGITYWPSTDKFFVSIDAKPFSTYKQLALDWFRAQGLSDPERQINIVFIAVGEAIR